MKLTSLDPRWLMKAGQRVGFTFISPSDQKWRQSCFAEPPPTREQWALFKIVHGDDFNVQGCEQDARWTITGGLAGASFETMTVTRPSLDGSRGGLWHGYIRNGEMVTA